MNYFIAGTDTGVGKTLVAGLVARELANEGLNVVTQKWVQTGCTGMSEDVLEHLAIMGQSLGDYEGFVQDMSPYVFPMAASPHLASKKHSMLVDTDKIIYAYKRLNKKYDAVVVEGAGGVMVPINEDLLMIDLVRMLDIPVILVAANKLGAINHTILSIETIRDKGLELVGVVFNQVDKNEDETILNDNPRIIQKFTGVSILVNIRYNCEKQCALVG